MCQQWLLVRLLLKVYTLDVSNK